ncbi:MAG TPA: SIMPL domain-containing protein [Gaiellaceae bacterium]|nr:SIMPL domain-containing protein [Gaiellaceae bacterium]
MRRRFRLMLSIAMLALAASAVAGIAQPHFGRAADAPATRTITVVGNGTASTVPDRASFEFGVQTHARTAREALAQNATLMTAVLDAVKAAGIAQADVSTQGIWLSQHIVSPGGTVSGYDASNGVLVKTPVAKAGPLVDAAVAAGATSVWGPNMTASDTAGLYRAALRDAVDDAHAKAQAMAAAAGLTLGAARTIREGVDNPYLPGVAATPGAGVASSTQPPPTPVVPGTRASNATVTVTYDVA